MKKLQKLEELQLYIELIAFHVDIWYSMYCIYDLYMLRVFKDFKAWQLS